MRPAGASTRSLSTVHRPRLRPRCRSGGLSLHVGLTGPSAPSGGGARPRLSHASPAAAAPAPTEGPRERHQVCDPSGSTDPRTGGCRGGFGEDPGGEDSHAARRSRRREEGDLTAACVCLPSGAGLGDHSREELRPPKLSPTGSSARNSRGHRPPSGESLGFPRVGNPHQHARRARLDGAGPGEPEGERVGGGWGASGHPRGRRAGSSGEGCRGQGRVAAGPAWAHAPQVHQEDVLDLLQDLQLPEHVAHLVPLDAVLLVHVLHGVHLLRVPLLHDAHLGAEGASGGRHHPTSHAGHGRRDSGTTGCLWWGKFLHKAPSESRRDPARSTALGPRNPTPTASGDPLPLPGARCSSWLGGPLGTKWGDPSARALHLGRPQP